MTTDTIELTAIEQEMIAYFVHLAGMINLPKSFGEIYGLLYASPEPLTFDEVFQKLQISKGSASQGLRALIALHAVKKHYVAGSRKDHYIAEQSLKKLISGFLRDKIEPHLESGQERLTQMKSLNDENDPFYNNQIETLQTWSRKAKSILPLIKTMVGK